MTDTVTDTVTGTRSRYAIYYAPPSSSELAALARHWLGRDAELDLDTGGAMALPEHGLDHQEITASARRYGFHATLKAPFALADPLDDRDLIRAVAETARNLVPVVLDGLKLKSIGGFYALVPVGDVTALNAFAFHLVQALDRFRKPAGAAELARRRKAGLTPGQEEMLAGWGYPYVGPEFRFHMTLTRRLNTDEAAKVEPVLQDMFAPVLNRPVTLGEIALFGDPGEGGPFSLIRRFPLQGRS